MCFIPTDFFEEPEYLTPFRSFFRISEKFVSTQRLIYHLTVSDVFKKCAKKLGDSISKTLPSPNQGFTFVIYTCYLQKLSGVYHLDEILTPDFKACT